MNVYKERVDFMVNINNLFKLISMKGITQSKLAEDTSVSTGNISDWKKGKSMPSAVKLDELATYFDCSVDYLLGRTDNPNINDNSIKTGDVKGINVKGDTSVTISETPKEHDTIKQNFIALFDNLSPENQIEVMYFTKQLMEKES